MLWANRLRQRLGLPLRKAGAVLVLGPEFLVEVVVQAVAFQIVLWGLSFASCGLCGIHESFGALLSLRGSGHVSTRQLIREVIR